MNPETWPPDPRCLDCGALGRRQCHDCARRDEAVEAARDEMRDGGQL